MGKKHSVIWQVSKEELQRRVDQSSSLKELLLSFGFSHSGNYKTIHDRCRQDEIDLSGLMTRSRLLQTRAFHHCSFRQQHSLEEILVQHSPYSRGHLKARLLKEGLIENRCANCGMDPIWRGKPLSLVLDHINGVRDDHRLENLRLLCPNCNSQTETFAGKKSFVCVRCGELRTKYGSSGLCRSCAQTDISSLQKSRSVCPSKEILTEKRSRMSREEVAREYGVSGNAVKRWEINLGIVGIDGRKVATGK